MSRPNAARPRFPLKALRAYFGFVVDVAATVALVLSGVPTLLKAGVLVLQGAGAVGFATWYLGRRYQWGRRDSTDPPER